LIEFECRVGLTSFKSTETVTTPQTMLPRSASNCSILSTASTASDSVSTACHKRENVHSGDRYHVVNLLIDHQLDSSMSSTCSSSLSCSLSNDTSRRASSPPSLQEDTDFACCAEAVAEAVEEARRMWVPAQHQHPVETSAETPTPNVRSETHPWSFASGLAYAPPHDECQEDPKLAALVDALDPQDFCFEELRRSLIAAGLQEHSRPIPHFI
jgi:hypothetical protein